jgi:LAS superfamily LD-carboxypeptidase LdcB
MGSLPRSGDRQAAIQRTEAQTEHTLLTDAVVMARRSSCGQRQCTGLWRSLVSQPSNQRRKAQIMRQLQQSHGNSFVRHHIVQQHPPKLGVQLRTDPVTLRPTRSGAQACLLHLHGNERNALQVAQQLYSSHCVNLAYIDHPGHRLIRVDVPGHHGVTCNADPNRIFNNAAIASQWTLWNSGRCLRGPIRSAAQQAVANYRDDVLNPAIRQCRGQPITRGQVGGTGVTGNLPIAVFHNNTPGSPSARPTRRGGRCRENLTIRSYLPGHCEAAATETDRRRTHGLPNPNIVSGQDVDNFMLVTDPRDFLTLRRSRNVVLQALNPPNDGSLSVVLSSGRYVNTEAESTRANFQQNQRLGLDALSALGVSPLPCPASPSSAPTSGPSADTQAAEAVQRKELISREEQASAIVQSPHALERAVPPHARPQGSTPDVQRDVFPSGIRTPQQRIRYLLGQFSPGGQDWTRVRTTQGTGHLRREVAAAYDRMRRAANRAGHTLQLVSVTRTFAQQRSIWNSKMRFERSRGSFGRFEPDIPPVSQKCRDILTAQDRSLEEWETRRTNHRRCWFRLSESERALEVLKTSSAPGTSRHHWGTDIDLNSVSPEDWERSPLSETYGWLSQHAHEFGFYQPYTARQARGNRGYAEEKWHWSYRPIAQPLLREYANLLFDPDVFRRELRRGGRVEAESAIVSQYQEYVSSVSTALLLSNNDIQMIYDIIRLVLRLIPSQLGALLGIPRSLSQSRTRVQRLAFQPAKSQEQTYDFDSVLRTGNEGMTLPGVDHLLIQSMLGENFSDARIHTH